jgi:uncharacterized Ntn-hydrolase superfamily protein
MTYAIVARDPVAGEIGATVQSHFFNAAAVVLWSEAGTGVVATMAMAEIAYGRLGLDLLRQGVSAESALEQLLRRDPLAAIRQVAMIGIHGRCAGYTGNACIPAAGHCAEENVVALGNMLTRDGTWDQMVEAFHDTKGTLAARLLAAMRAAEAFGGDIRGVQSAGLVVVSAKAEAHTTEQSAFASAPRIDLRVEDHAAPLAELQRLLELDSFYKDLLGLLKMPGLFAGTIDAAEPQRQAAIATLTHGQRLLGENQEATFWLAVLLARMGEMSDARLQFAAAVRVHPPLREMASRLVGAGMLTTAQSVALATER